jgi:hypothetical protein
LIQLLCLLYLSWGNQQLFIPVQKQLQAARTPEQQHSRASGVNNSSRAQQQQQDVEGSSIAAEGQQYFIAWVFYFKEEGGTLVEFELSIHSCTRLEVADYVTELAENKEIVAIWPRSAE